MTSQLIKLFVAYCGEMPTEVHGLGGRAAAAFDSYDSNDDFEDYREMDS